MERKYALIAEFTYCTGMISNMKQSGNNPNEYIKQAKKVIRKMQRVDRHIASSFKDTLNGIIKDPLVASSLSPFLLVLCIHSGYFQIVS